MTSTLLGSWAVSGLKVPQGEGGPVGSTQLAQGPEVRKWTLISRASLDWAVVAYWVRMGPNPADGPPNVLASRIELACPPGVRRKAWWVPRRRCATPVPGQSASRSTPRRAARSSRLGGLAGHKFGRGTALGCAGRPAGALATSQTARGASIR
jgi:hypothetical protein